MPPGSASLIWSEYGPQPTSPDHLSCDLSGHFWAEAERDADQWSFVIWDYQGNKMLAGLAESLEGAQAAVDGWNAWVVTSDRDPSKDWPDE